jgi:hypothetical protein
MPIDIIPKSLYPVVPQALGVPTLLRSGAQLLDTVTLGYLGASDALSQVIGSEVVRWGVYDASGTSIGDYDTMAAVEYRNDANISDYPVEDGSFASYNKVDSAFDVSVRMVCGGSDARRAAFQAACETARRTLRLFTIVTPTRTYQDVNFVSIGVHHTRTEGANLLTVELQAREVRNTASEQQSDAKTPAAYDAQDQGSIQTVDDPSIDISGLT